MKIKRTIAPDMRTAMKLIREEQGPDAVILGNRRVSGGIEIVSAIDYEVGAVDSSNLFADNPAATATATATATEAAVAGVGAAPVIERRAPEPAAPPAVARARWDAHNRADVDDAERSVRRATELLRAARANGKSVEKSSLRSVLSKTPSAASIQSNPTPSPSPRLKQALSQHLQDDPFAPLPPLQVPERQLGMGSGTAEVENTQIKGMQQELQAMRELMAQQLNVMGWGNMTRRQPARVNLLTRLHHMGLGTELALQLCEGVDSATDPSRNWREALMALQAQVIESRDDMIEHGGVFAMIGTTGVGKTSNIAKLAALCAMRHGKESIALISTDNMRVGAREQLRSFAAILDVPMVFSENAEQLEREVQRLRERKLVLIDTAGLSVNDANIGQHLAQIRRVKTIQPILNLAANAQLGALQQSCRVFGNCDPVGCIISKVDEAHSMGAVITAVVEHRLPLNWFGTGQRVPEDLSRATAAGLMRLGLSTEALRKPALLDADELASHFGQVGSYAGA